MDKEELNAKLGYNKELLEQLSNAFDLQEDYNDHGWDKLFEICRYIYNLEQQCEKQKEVIDKAIEFIKSSQCKYDGWEITNQLYENEIKQLLDILKEVSK
jgi:hypothetical protein